MRSASVSQRASGSNQVGVRQYNERLILSLIREHDALTKAEIAKATNLTPQTASTIINRLMEQDLLIAGTKRRGGLGQPSTPYALNPEGAFSIGVKIGRASLEVLFMDMTGNIRTRLSHEYPFPTPKEVYAKIEQSINTLLDPLDDLLRSRVTGVGLAAPFALEGWGDELIEAKEALSEWAKIDLLEELEKVTDLDAAMLNDATAACLAELTFGNPRSWENLLYFYIGTFIGGGIVLNGQILPGSQANAGALGSVPCANDKQLIHYASLHQLDKRLKSESIVADFANLSETLEQDAWTLFTEWADNAAPYIAQTIAAGSAFIDPDGVIIDGRLPAVATQYLVLAVNRASSDVNWEGLNKPPVIAGNLGFEARALGGALLPIYSNFGLDNQAFLKSAQ